MSTIVVPNDIAYRLISTGPVVMVSTLSKSGVPNVMTNAWNCPLDSNPTKILLVISSGTQTRLNIDETGEFIVNVSCIAQKNLMLKVGSCHGKEHDKFNEFSISHTSGTKVSVPRINGCIAWLECRLIKEPVIAQKYDIIMGEVIYAEALSEAFDGKQLKVSNSSYSTVHHLSAGEFAVFGK